ncbi:lipoprotein [Hyphomicrobiales bacterium]|jgi:predicted small lipoprotein YifL|nr:lipoprotein [Hyphomicrobiales bacterium]|tara:strand:+ start:334 stop:471 length:138 start_codon:yes stop_codon:yes gene_type:complete
MIKKYLMTCIILVFVISLASCGIKGALEPMSDKKSDKDFILDDLI